VGGYQALWVEVNRKRSTDRAVLENFSKVRQARLYVPFWNTHFVASDGDNFYNITKEKPLKMRPSRIQTALL